MLFWIKTRITTGLNHIYYFGSSVKKKLIIIYIISGTSSHKWTTTFFVNTHIVSIAECFPAIILTVYYTLASIDMGTAFFWTSLPFGPASKCTVVELSYVRKIQVKESLP